MECPLNSIPGSYSDGVESSPPDTNIRRLYDNISRGFALVLERLAEIENNFANVPAQRAEGLTSQHGLSVNGLAESSQIQQAADVLAAKNRELEIENMALKAQVQLKDKEIERKAETEAELKKELDDLRRDFGRSQQNEAKLRSIILSSAGTQQITDQEVVQTFSDLRQKVQQLASTEAFDFAATSPGLFGGSQAMNHFYAVCRRLRNKTDVVNRLKAHIFAILHAEILNKPLFGLKGLGDQGKKYEQVLWNIDENLARFQEFLSAHQMDEGMIADWRICTLDCVARLQLSEQYSHCVAATLHNSFAPLVPKQVSQSQRDKLRERLIEVCRKSVELRMMMQRSKEGYCVHSLGMKEYPAWPSMTRFADVMGVEGGMSSDDASDEIHYVLFGALTKDAKPFDEMKVLVKAEVILRKRK